MKHIYLNLKRFDIPATLGGVNRIAPPAEWAPFIIKNTKEGLQPFRKDAVFTMFFPEAHIIPAAVANGANSPIAIGCQSVFFDDTGAGSFGAFTTSRTANAMHALGASATIIGHCEERKALAAVMVAADVANTAHAVNTILCREIKCALAVGLDVLYCVGEKSEEQSQWEETLAAQLGEGLARLDTQKVTIAYEPVWAIGPGKIPPDAAYITKIAQFIKKETNNLPVVYGGGLKKENAAQLASIPEIDGGLIALTRFSGEIGFYPDEYLEIIRIYLEAK